MSDIAVELSCNLSGTITNMGLPVAGTNVRIYDYCSHGTRLTRRFLTETVTEQIGKFSFSLCPGVYCLEITACANTRFAKQLLTAVNITQDVELSIILKPGYFFSGLIHNHLGQPMIGGEMLLFDAQSYNLQFIHTIDQEGRFQIAIPSGNYRIAIRLSDNNSIVENSRQNNELLPFFSWLPEILELNADCRQTVCLPQPVSFTGVISDQNKNPVLGVEVLVKAYDIFWRTNYEVMTNMKTENVINQNGFATIGDTTKANGHFSFLLCPDAYQVYFKPSSQSDLSELFIDKMVIDNNKHDNYVLEPGYTLKGKVISNNEVVPGIRIIVYNARHKFIQFSDINGDFSFSLPVDRYKIFAVYDVYYSDIEKLGEQKVFCQEFTLDRQMEMDLCLDQGTAVACKIRDPLNRACPQVRFSLYALEDGILASCMKEDPLVVGVTDEQGCCDFYITPGDYWFVLNNQPNAGWVVHINNNGENKTNLAINYICLVSFEILSESGQPIANSKIYYEPYDIDSSKKEDLSKMYVSKTEVAVVQQATVGLKATNPISQKPIITDENGQCVIALPMGIYAFYIQPTGEFQPKTIRQLSVSNNMTRRVRLDRS